MESERSIHRNDFDYTIYELYVLCIYMHAAWVSRYTHRKLRNDKKLQKLRIQRETHVKAHFDNR